MIEIRIQILCFPVQYQYSLGLGSSANDKIVADREQKCIPVSQEEGSQENIYGR